MESISDNCIQCTEPVRQRQQGIQCDGCHRWNHRTCNTGISQAEYRDAVRAGADIIWFCPFCPVAESTRLTEHETSADILESEEFNPPRPANSTAESTIYDPPQSAIDESSIEEPILEGASQMVSKRPTF